VELFYKSELGSISTLICSLTLRGNTMSVKTNLLVAAAAVLGVSSAYAGGPEMMAAPAAPSFTPFFYAELGLGFAETAYEDFDASAFSVFNDIDNANGGMSYAGDFGYQFMPHMAVELGGGMLPELKINDASAQNTKLSSWYAYGAGRIDTAVMNDKLDVFSKFGLAYRSGSAKNDGTLDDSETWYAPFFGAGASYSVRDNIYVALEYNFIGSQNDSEHDFGTVPSANIYLGKVGYKFNF